MRTYDWPYSTPLPSKGATCSLPHESGWDSPVGAEMLVQGPFGTWMQVRKVGQKVVPGDESRDPEYPVLWKVVEAATSVEAVFVADSEGTTHEVPFTVEGRQEALVLLAVEDAFYNQHPDRRFGSVAGWKVK